MAAPTFDRERAVRILLDALDMGDAKACAHHRITSQTLRNYRKRLADDPELLRALAVKRAELDHGWKRERVEALRAGIRKMQELFGLAGIEQLYAVTGAVKVLGELHIASEVLDDDGDGADRQDAEPAPPAGHAPGGEDPPVH